MAQLRLALAQSNPVVGDLDGNAAQVLSWTRQATDKGAHIVAFPEMALTGYPVEDLALRRSFQDASRTALADVAAELGRAGLGDRLVILGYLDSAPGAPSASGASGAPSARGASGAPGASTTLGVPAGAPQDAAAFLYDGRIVGRYAKHHLPNYGVFDEFRYFVPGESLTVARIHGVDVAVVVCEDIWQDGGPVATVRDAGAGLLVVINGSPYERNKDDTRLELVRRRAADTGAVLAYVNMVGGQDELVFDGDSIVVTPDGEVLARAPQFEERLLVVDLDLPGASKQPAERNEAGDRAVVRLLLGDKPLAPYPALAAGIAPRIDDEAEVYAALVTGVHDYVAKNGFQSVVIALSGGIDSALTAAIACDALGAANVHGVSMPSSYSSEHSKSDAADLAERTGLNFSTVPVAPMVDAFLASIELTGLAEENLQARVRGIALMGLSNEHGHLVLATGNKSELAVGYSTLYGDAVGAYAPLKDVPKTLVWRLSRWRNKDAESRGETPPIPEASISKPPSAELRPGQLDSDSLPDYAELDDILDDYVEMDRGSSELVAAGFDQGLVERVLKMTDTAEYKRRQYPPGPKISFKAFGRDRRLPITNRWREHLRPPSPG